MITTFINKRKVSAEFSHEIKLTQTNGFQRTFWVKSLFFFSLHNVGLSNTLLEAAFEY